MIMSYYTKIEMSGYNHDIIPHFERGYYSGKGHYQNESKGIKENTGYSKCNK